MGADNRGKIRKELKQRMNQLIAEGNNKNKALNTARAEINKKYGHGWRENIQSNVKAGDEPTIYDDHVNGEHWMD